MAPLPPNRIVKAPGQANLRSVPSEGFSHRLCTAGLRVLRPRPNPGSMVSSRKALTPFRIPELALDRIGQDDEQFPVSPFETAFSAQKSPFHDAERHQTLDNYPLQGLQRCFAHGARGSAKSARPTSAQDKLRAVISCLVPQAIDLEARAESAVADTSWKATSVWDRGVAGSNV